jgi:GPR1/FUN34/yaaH family
VLFEFVFELLTSTTTATTITMATNSDHAAPNQNGANITDVEKATQHMSHEEKRTAAAAAKFGYGPLAHMRTSDIATLPAFGGEFQPGLYKSVEGRKFANPAPLGLCAFALTTFVLSLINLGTRGLTAPNIVVSLAFGYGGLVQLLAGMWYVLAQIPFLPFPFDGEADSFPGKWPWATLSVLRRSHLMAAFGSHTRSS